MVSNQKERLLEDFKTRLHLSKLPQEKVNEEVEKYDKRLMTDAEQMVNRKNGQSSRAYRRSKGLNPFSKVAVPRVAASLLNS